MDTSATDRISESVDDNTRHLSSGLEPSPLPRSIPRFVPFAASDDDSESSEAESESRIGSRGHKSHSASTRLERELRIDMTEPVQLEQPNTVEAVETNGIPPVRPPPLPCPTFDPHCTRSSSKATACAPQHYPVEHVHYELDSKAPMTASKPIGKAIKKGMRYVNYRHKETGSLKEIELGLTEQQIRTRLKGATQASGRKVRPMTTL